MKDAPNRFLYHWLPASRFERFQRQGLLKPYWTHFIIDRMQMVKGISTCYEPMVWVPDDHLDPEFCLVIDREAFAFESLQIKSGETYHLTKNVKRCQRNGNDIEAVVAHHKELRRYSRFSKPDEEFILTTIPWKAVVAVGYQAKIFETPHSGIISGLQMDGDLACIDMTDWEVGSPGFMETDDLIASEIETLDQIQQLPTSLIL